VREAIDQKVPAALVLSPPEALDVGEVDQVRIAFDGDAVLFDDESERYYQDHGIDAFMDREKELAEVPMDPGPFKPFLAALGRIQDRFPERDSPVRLALVTARNAPAHKRVIKTLRDWKIRIDESVFLGGIDKADVLAAMRPHIYFDDQLTHLERAREIIPAAHVLGGGEQERLFEPPEPEEPQWREDSPVVVELAEKVDGEEAVAEPRDDANVNPPDGQEVG
jgi:5'-nucleotidase